MNKNSQHKRQDAIAEEAATWFVELESADTATRQSFAEWLKISPEHVEEFLAIADIWDMLPDTLAQPSVDELVNLACSCSNVEVLAGRDHRVTGSSDESLAGKPARVLRKMWSGFAIAATLAAVMIGGATVFLSAPTDTNVYSTAIGEQMSVALPDGSIVTLNTKTKLRVAYSDNYRDVELISGEALFEVEKNKERPFRVVTNHAIARAVGTKFTVMNNPDEVTVSVVEGIVDVSSGSKDIRPEPIGASSQPDHLTALPPHRRLVVGQQAKIQSSSGELAVVETPVDNIVAWKDRRLVFDFTPLKEVIADFNRYNDPPIKIDDASLDMVPIDGVFQSNDRKSFVLFLAKMHLAEAKTLADGTIVLRAYPDKN